MSLKLGGIRNHKYKVGPHHKNYLAKIRATPNTSSPSLIWGPRDMFSVAPRSTLDRLGGILIRVIVLAGCRVIDCVESTMLRLSGRGGKMML